MKKTKIIATIGPASAKKETLKQMIEHGMDVARFNLTHASHEFCKQGVQFIQELNKELGTNVAIMFDTKGPDVRLGRFANGHAYLKKGDKIRIYTEDLLGDSTKFSVNYEDIVKKVPVNTILKLDDGKLELKVLDKGFDFLLCEVLVEGLIEDYKGVNIPSVNLNLPFLSDKDKEDIIFASEVGVDFLALSFVSSHENILEVNDLLISLGNDHMGIIAKIENEHAIDEIDDIVRVSDGVMIARGDLGVEIPMEQVPGIQKRVIKKCQKEGKISIVATEMLSSMEHGIRPTRAEVSDVANAVLDGTDSVLLSGETTVGRFPVETLDIMTRIIETAEQDIDHAMYLKRTDMNEEDVTGTISYSVLEAANHLDCKAIVIPTKSGYTARKVSRLHPKCPIFALTPDEDTLRSLALNFGVYTKYVKEFKNFEDLIEGSKQAVQSFLPVEKKDQIIITGGYPFDLVQSTNFMKIEEL